MLERHNDKMVSTPAEEYSGSRFLKVPIRVRSHSRPPRLWVPDGVLNLIVRITGYWSFKRIVPYGCILLNAAGLVLWWLHVGAEDEQASSMAGSLFAELDGLKAYAWMVLLALAGMRLLTEVYTTFRMPSQSVPAQFLYRTYRFLTWQPNPEECPARARAVAQAAAASRAMAEAESRSLTVYAESLLPFGPK